MLSRVTAKNVRDDFWDTLYIVKVTGFPERISHNTEYTSLVLVEVCVQWYVYPPVHIRDMDAASCRYQKAGSFPHALPTTILNITWQDHIPSSMRQSWRQQDWRHCEISCPSGGRLFSRLNPDIPAHQALWMQTDLSTGRKPDVRWRRTPGRSRKTWCSQIWTDVGMSHRNYWDACRPIHRGHSRVTQRSRRATR